MKPFRFVILAMFTALPLQAEAGPPVIQGTSLVRVRADNHFGVTKDHVITPVFDLVTTDTIVDEEVGTSATATTTATYNITLSGTTATFAIQNSAELFRSGAGQSDGGLHPVHHR